LPDECGRYRPHGTITVSFGLYPHRRSARRRPGPHQYMFNPRQGRTKNISSSDKRLIEQTKVLTKDLKNDMNNQNLNNYIKSVINISFLTNKYINDEEPWKLKKNNIEKMNNILHIALEQIAKISILFNPIIPNATSKVLDALNIKPELRNLSFLDGSNIFTNEIKIKELDILFKKIT